MFYQNRYGSFRMTSHGGHVGGLSVKFTLIIVWQIGCMKIVIPCIYIMKIPWKLNQ